MMMVILMADGKLTQSKWRKLILMGKMPKNMMLNSTIQVGITVKVNAVLQPEAIVKVQLKDRVIKNIK